MSFDSTKVRLILRSHLATIPEFPGHSLVQYENRTWDAPDPDGTDWIREYMEPVAEDWAASNTIEHSGNYRIDVVVPSGDGTERMEALSDAIKNAYFPGLTLADVPKTCAVRINRSHRRPARRDTRDRAWYAQSVIISWVVYTTFSQQN